MIEYLFAYGTLQKETVQLKLFGRKLMCSPDHLSGYKLSPIVITDEIFLARGEQKEQMTIRYTNDPYDIIAGTVYEIKPEELLFTDQYEPEGYERISVTLVSGKSAWIYLSVNETGSL